MNGLRGTKPQNTRASKTWGLWKCKVQICASHWWVLKTNSQQSVAELWDVSYPLPSLYSYHFLNILIAYWSHVWGKWRNGLITSFSSEWPCSNNNACRRGGNITTGGEINLIRQVLAEKSEGAARGPCAKTWHFGWELGGELSNVLKCQQVAQRRAGDFLSLRGRTFVLVVCGQPEVTWETTATTNSKLQYCQTAKIKTRGKKT